MGVLKEAEAGAEADDPSRNRAVPEAHSTAKHGGLEMSEAERLRVLED